MKLISYTGNSLNSVTASADQTVRAVMAIMSNAGLRFLPITSSDGSLAGGVADGDLRRYLAQGGNLEDPITQALNPHPKFITSNMSASELRAYMIEKGIESLPQTEKGHLIALHVLSVTQSKSDITAVIMAGGLGSRLAPLTDECPKPLLHVGDKPILTHIIEHLRSQGICKFIISVNYLSGMIIDHYGDGSEMGVDISYVHETMRMGTGGALGLINPELLSEPFLVLNGDLLNDLDVQKLRDRHDKNGWQATMVVREHHYTIPYGVVINNENGEFITSEEKPTYNYRINAGMYLLSKDVLPLVPPKVFYDLPTLFADISTHGMKAGTHTHPGRWIDIGNIADYNRAQSIFERKS